MQSVNTNPLSHSAARLPWAGVLAAVALAAGPALPAQTASPAGEQPITLEAFTVTGTNIKRMDMENVLPVTVISREAMEARSAITPVDMLTSLPQVTNIPLNEAATGGLGARGDVSAVNLRGIGASSSLILLNGRRLAPHPQSGALSYSVNVNQLPTQGLSRIDVLRDGASATYGSDAVAGVLNYIMRNDYRGTELKVRWGLPEQAGGANVQTTLTHGLDFAGGKGRLLSTLDYLYRDAIWLRDRDFSANTDHSPQAPPPWNIPGSPFDGRGTVGFYPTFRIGSGTATNYFRPINGVPALTSVAPTRANNPEYYLDVNRFAAASPRSNRVNWFNGLEYDLGDRVTFFADASYYQADSVLGRMPALLNAPGDQAAPMSVNNPFNPYGSRFYHPTGVPNADGTPRLVGEPRPISLLTEAVADLRPDRFLILSKTWRAVAGLRGRMFDAWNWETGALWSRAAIKDRAPYAVRESLLHAALARTDGNAFNPFGYTFRVQGNAVVADQRYTNPDSVMAGFVQEWSHDGMSEIASIDANASGPVYALWAGDVSMAFGGEYRREKFEDTRPPFVGINPPGSGLNPNDNDFINASPRLDNRGSRTIASFYAEMVVPLAAPKNEVPLVESLELTASVRHERYSDFGNATKPKFGLNWKPVPAIMVRGSYNEGFVAPSLPALNQPVEEATNPLGDPDPYRNQATSEGNYLYRRFTSGGPTLQPTNSEGKSYGVVLEVPGIRGLSLTVDRWEINQYGVIGNRSLNEVAGTDAFLLRTYTQQQVAAGVPVGSINAGSGTAAYHGDPAITRFAPTPEDIAAFAAYNAANPNAPLAAVGKISEMRLPYLNIAEDYAAGWDFGVNYSVPELSIGKLMFNSEWSYLDESYTITNVPGSASLYSQRVNVDGAARWRGTTVLSWRKGNWSGSVSGYYIGSFASSGATTTAAIYESLSRPEYIVGQIANGVPVYRYRTEDVWTFNGFVSYRFDADRGRWLGGSAIRLGVINVADTPPPLGPSNYGYAPAVHGTLATGRTWTLELTKQF